MKDLEWTFDTRVKIDDALITFATKCISPEGKQAGIASVAAKARISNDDISILESKNDEKKLTRRDRFLAEIETITPWDKLQLAIEPFYPKVVGAGRPPIGLAHCQTIQYLCVATVCHALSRP